MFLQVQYIQHTITSYLEPQIWIPAETRKPMTFTYEHDEFCQSFSWSSFCIWDPVVATDLLILTERNCGEMLARELFVHVISIHSHVHWCWTDRATEGQSDVTDSSALVSSLFIQREKREWKKQVTYLQYIKGPCLHLISRWPQKFENLEVFLQNKFKSRQKVILTSSCYIHILWWCQAGFLTTAFSYLH